jgi:Cu2+-exporting ATPase
LGRYYDLGGGRGAPAREVSSSQDLKWLEGLDTSGGRCTLDAQGIHCTACVWLFEELYARLPGAQSILVNPALGTLQLQFGPEFSLEDFVRATERFGYRLGPSKKGQRPADSGLLLRMGVCIAIAMNAMIFAVAFYAGLNEGPLFRLFHHIEIGLAALSVFVGGSVFFRSAYEGLRRGVLHLDMPIALGIALAFGSSTLSYLNHSRATYFDTLTVFIALMLVGRWLQERVIERNRRQLLESDGADGLLTRTVREGLVSVVPCTSIELGATLLIAPGDLVPVDGTLDQGPALCSMDWINGESEPKEVAAGETVPAGAFNAGPSAFVLRAEQAFKNSLVLSLLQVPRARGNDEARSTPFWRSLAKVYVASVLLVATVGFGGWLLATHDLRRAMEVMSGILIVTCPCAFGIATPLAYELALAGLRRAGLFVRSSGFLDRAPEITDVVFDKTGTLTTGSLRVSESCALGELSAEDAFVLYNMTARSGHPKSVAIARALGGALLGGNLRVSAPRLDPAFHAEERAGVGVSAVHQGKRYSLRAAGEDLAFRCDETTRLTLQFTEDLRRDAKDEVRVLERMGYKVYIASGDEKGRVEAMGAALGLPADRLRFAASPQEKAEFVAAHPKALMVGDGLNDSLAVDSAFASGTPAIDRPFLPARTDFYFTTPGLRPIALALRAARTLQRVTRRNLTIAVAYNVVSVALAWAGLLSPLVCAIVMPLSSVSVVLLTTASLSERSPLWRS